MRPRVFTRHAILFALAAVVLVQTPASPSAALTKTTAAAVAAAAPVQSGNVNINGFYSVNRAQRGRTIQAAVVLDIPDGYHVNSNRPLGKYAVATTLKIDAPRGIRISPVSFPRAVVRSLQFSQGERLAVYEGRAVMRFNVSVPADFQEGVTELRARIRFQACTNEICYPPATRDLTLPLGIVGANDPVQRINGQFFGGGGGRRKR